MVTRQIDFDSYENSGVRLAAELTNAFATEQAFGRAHRAEDPRAELKAIFASDPTWPSLRPTDVPGLLDLARRLRVIFDLLGAGDVDPAAEQLNDLLAASPAHPHLSKDEGTWHLHHHPDDAGLVAMATAICAEGLARTIGAGVAFRLGVCEASACERAFVDHSKNGTRAYCSTRCQNRTKAAAFRRRRAASTRRS